MSAFLFYSQENRARLRKEFPDMKNIDVSILLASRWKVASADEKQPHIDKERMSREKYYTDLSAYKIAELKRKRLEEIESTVVPVLCGNTHYSEHINKMRARSEETRFTTSNVRTAALHDNQSSSPTSLTTPILTNTLLCTINAFYDDVINSFPSIPSPPSHTFSVDPVLTVPNAPANITHTYGVGCEGYGSDSETSESFQQCLTAYVCSLSADESNGGGSSGSGSRGSGSGSSSRSSSGSGSRDSSGGSSGR